MLTPVSAISAVGSAQKQAAVTPTPSTVALSSSAAVSAALSQATSNAEARLNILLASIKDRMVQSLLDIMDSLAQALDAPREQDESEGAHALRLADIVQNLTPKQLATVQQQLQSQGQTIPLPILAQALKDPTGPAAAAMVAYLETAHDSGRDRVTEAVIESYSENDGVKRDDSVAEAVQAPRLATAPGQTSPNAASPATQAPTAAAPVNPAATSQGAMAAEIAEQVSDDLVSPLAIAAAEAADDSQAIAGNETEMAPADVLAQAMEIIGDEQAADSAASSLAPMADVPIALKDIAADVQEGLKVAIQFAMEAAGPEIADIVANHEAIAETAIADAMMADVLDAAELAEPAIATATDETSLPMAPPTALAGSSEETDSAVPLTVGLSQILQDAANDAPATAMTAALPPQPVAQPLGVPFVVGQYPLAPDVVADRDASRVDRIDPVDDEAEDDRNRQQQAKDEAEHEHAEAEQQESAAGDADTAGNEPSVAAEDPAMNARDAAPMPRALPSPGMSMRQEAYGFFQRMAAE